MRTPHAPSLAACIASVRASIAVTSLIVGNQFGIDDLYSSQTGSVLAARALKPLVAQQAVAAKPRRS
jgi:hypothetical protein